MSTITMDFFEVIAKRRSVRRFTDGAVKEGDLKVMLDAARLAPSSHNAQPWHFIVVRSPELRDGLKEVVNAAIDARRAGENGDKAPVRDQRFYATSVFNAPVVIVALTHPVPSPVPGTLPKLESGLLSTAAALAQLHLAATALGYGSCWSTLPLSWARAPIEALLGVKEPWRVAAFLAIGVPAKIPRKVAKKPIGEIMSFK